MSQEVKEIKWLKTLEKPIMMLYSPIAYSRAIALGAVLVFTESKLVQLIRKHIRPDMDNPDLGTPRQRFAMGYYGVLRAYKYRR